MKIDDLSLYRAFCGVAHSGNFARAAENLGSPVSQISKRVSRLEEHLGVRLFQRSTRAVSLTEEGQILLAKVKPLLDEMDGLEGSFKSEKELSGTIRVTSVSFVAQNLLLPLIKKFRKLHPKLKIELLLTERVVNLIEENLDLAIRIQTPRDSELIYRKLVPNELVFCATPQYLRKHGAPKKPEDLAQHELLLLKIHESCLFKGSTLSLRRCVKLRGLESDNGAFLTDYALNDGGILVRSIWDVQKHLRSGKLIQVLEKHPLEKFGDIHVVIPSRKLLAPRSRALYEFILTEAKSWK